MSDVLPRPVAGPPRPYAFPTVERTQLGNGLQVLVVPLRRLPVATALLYFDAGAECDAVEESGVAALTAASLAEGTRRLGAVALTDAFERLGASLETEASWTQAACSSTVLSARLDDVLALLAEVVREPAFPDVDVTRLRDERLAELLQQRTEPRALADDMFARFTFAAGTRYARPEGGDEDTVRGLARAAVMRHHAHHVVPSRGGLIVVGDVDAGHVVQLAERTLGDWGATGRGPARVVPAPASGTRGVHLVAKDDAPQSELRVGHPSVPRTHPDFHALTVMNAILGGLFNSRINLNLREVHAYTYGAFSHFSWRRAASTFEVSTAVQSEVTAEAVREILHEIDRMRSEQVTPRELSLAVDYLTGVFPLRFETTAALADALALREGYGLAPDYYDSYRARIAAVTADEVLRVAQGHLEPGQLQIVAVGDPAIVRAPLEALAFGPVTRYDTLGRQLEH